MIKLLSKSGIITSSQFGFRANSSTDLAITSFYDKLLNNSDENKITFSRLKKGVWFSRSSATTKKVIGLPYHYGFRAGLGIDTRKSKEIIDIQ